MSEQPLNLPERLLANELAKLLAEKMDVDLQRVDGEVYNIGQSNYECACYALNLVGIYQQAGHYTRHRIMVPAELVAQHMMNLEGVSRKAFDALLSAFVENYIGYDGRLTAYRRDFRVQKKFLNALNLLAKSGYAEQAEGSFRWTEKIAPPMRRWHYWDENNVCKAEQVDILETAIAVQLEQSIPPRIRQKLISAIRSRDPRKEHLILQRHLNGMEWREFPMFQRKVGPTEDGAKVTLGVLGKLTQLIKEKS